jgi:hypothetical protein
MVYYLGRDVKVYLTTESTEAQVDVVNNEVTTTGSGAAADIASVATITNADNGALLDSGAAVITIITTDATTITATAHDTTTSSLASSNSGTFDVGASGSDTMTNIASLLNSHPKLTSTASGDVTTITQAVGGTAGNTTITIVDPGSAGLTISQQFTGGYDEPDFSSGSTFAENLDSSPALTKIADLTGVDLGIGVTDEDITYMGSKTVLKAEIKKETTISLTRKKSNNVWDVVYNGPTAASKGWNGAVETGDYGARWGVIEGAADTWYVNGGLMAPKDATDFGGTDLSFGYRVHIVLCGVSGQEEVISIPSCQLVGHTVSLNADGTTEETCELVSQVTPKIGSAANYTRITAAQI